MDILFFQSSTNRSTEDEIFKETMNQHEMINNYRIDNFNTWVTPMYSYKGIDIMTILNNWIIIEYGKTHNK